MGSKASNDGPTEKAGCCRATRGQACSSDQGKESTQNSVESERFEGLLSGVSEILEEILGALSQLDMRLAVIEYNQRHIPPVNPFTFPPPIPTEPWPVLGSGITWTVSR